MEDPREDFSACASRADLASLDKEQLVEIVMRQERDCTRLTRDVSRLTDYERAYKAIVSTPDVRSPDSVLERLIKGGDYKDWRLVVECGRDLVSEVRRLRLLLSEYQASTAAVLDEFHGSTEPVTSKTLRRLWTVYRESAGSR